METLLQTLLEQAKFYEKLYKNDSSVRFSMQNTNGTKITDEQREYLDSPLTQQEFQKVLRDFPSEKSPGCDGLLAEVYQCFWTEIQEPYLAAIQHAVANGELHISARRGILTLIPKKDRDPLTLKNWRPLTMLTIDYKLYAKVLDNRLKQVLPQVIAETQTGFMSQRNILTNIVKMIQLMRVADAKKLTMLVMLIDFEKCFDLVSHTAI